MTEAARDVLSKVIDRYMKAGYGTVEPAFFEPYTDDSPYAANGDEHYSVTDAIAALRTGDVGRVILQPDSEATTSDTSMRNCPECTGPLVNIHL